VIRKDSEFLVFSNPWRLAIIDPEKVLQIIGEQRIQAWTMRIERGESVLDLLRTVKRDLIPEDIAARILPLEGGPGQTRELRLQLHTTLGPLAPGSSIKGAMRTAWFVSELLKKLPQPIPEDLIQFDKKYPDKPLNKKLMGKNPNFDSGRFFRVGDAHFPNRTEARTAVVLNLKNEEWVIKQEVTQLIEVIPPESVATFSLTLDTTLRNNHQFRHVNWDLLEPANFMRMINDQTIDLLKAEKEDIWDSETGTIADPGQDYIEHITGLLGQAKSLNNETSCIMRMSYGSGWNWMTGDWASDEDLVPQELYEKIIKASRRANRTDTPFPKTRKMTSLGEPLGFVKLEITD